MKKVLFIGVLSLLLIGSSFVFAQSYNSGNSVPASTPITPWCRGFSHNMFLGSTDFSTNGEVSILQNFLVSRGLLTIPSGANTGYFGFLTRAALVRFQASANIYPAVGFFGPITRAYIANLCGSPPPPSSSLYISSMTPSSGPVGTSVTVYGSGFSSTGNTVNFDGGAIMNLQSFNGASITFSVPDSLTPACYYSTPRCLIATRMTEPGNYSVSVSNSNGTSNSIIFTVTPGQSNSNSPVISGVSAPATLAVNQTGTWTVSASDPNNGTLSYSVDWGERVSYGSQAQSASTNQSFQQSTSFTHSYSQAGTYTQTFNVRNNSGGQAQTTTTVQVGGSSSTNAPYINYLSPTSGNVGAYVTIYGSRLSSDSRIQFGSGSIQPLAQGCAADSSNCDFTTWKSFQVPQYVSPYCPPGSACPQYVQQITPGTYAVSVINGNGTSNTVYFTVTGPCPTYASCGAQPY